MKPRIITAAAILLIFAPLLPVHAQDERAAAAPKLAVTVAPREAREVVAEGRAAIGVGGIPGARGAATAQALRNAVEKALGVYVSARSLTQNYVLVRDQVITRADGFATLKEVVRESVGTQEVRVTVRALVSLRPLAQQLKALKLTRAWRVHVTSGGRKGGVSKDGAAEEDTDEAVTTLERILAEAGFVVVSEAREADIAVRVSPRFQTLQETRLETAAGPMTMNSVRGNIGVRATRAGTGEVVAALSAADTGLHINLATARSETADAAMTVLAPRLADALLILPAQDSQPITLVVSNLPRIGQVGVLEDALQTLPGVRGVTRRAWAGGKATWELDVSKDALHLLARELEESAPLRPFRLSVASEEKARIVASVKVSNPRPKGR